MRTADDNDFLARRAASGATYFGLSFGFMFEGGIMYPHSTQLEADISHSESSAPYLDALIEKLWPDNQP